MNIYKRIMWSRYGWFLKGLPDLRRASALMKIRHNTMTSHQRSKTLWDFSREICLSGIPGDFVECGVWKGGAAGIMGLALQTYDTSGSRKLQLFDSFEGLPEPTAEDGVEAAIYSGGVNSGSLNSVHQCEAGIGEVRRFLINQLQLPGNRIVFHEGWFQNTLPALGVEPSQIALLRLDGDWYESTKVCFTHLYSRVAVGGIILLDDYHCWEGCKKATDEFREHHKITSQIVRIDSEAVYWIKE